MSVDRGPVERFDSLPRVGSEGVGQDHALVPNPESQVDLRKYSL